MNRGGMPSGTFISRLHNFYKLVIKSFFERYGTCILEDFFVKNESRKPWNE